jgi:hypothetical protein
MSEELDVEFVLSENQEDLVQSDSFTFENRSQKGKYKRNVYQVLLKQQN